MQLKPFPLVLIALTGAAAQSPAPATPRIAGAANFRDLGGYSTTDGRVVRHGLIFRSGELSHLTDADFQTLASWRVGYVFDLRTDAERADATTVWRGTSPDIVAIPVGFDAKADPSASLKALFANGADAAHAMEAMRTVTAQIAIDGAPGIGQVLHALSSGHEPAIVHCTAGKDRTGVVSAFLLTVLGVPRETVYEDYLRSNAAVQEQMARMKAASTTAPGAPGVSSALASLPPETIKVMMGVDRSYLDAAFAAVNAKYGSFDAYVSQGLKLTPADVQGLRTRLLEPAR